MNETFTNLFDENINANNKQVDNENKTFNIGLIPKVNMRKVLVVSYYFPPMGLSGVQRTLKFVKYLPKYDWHPIVLTTGATNYYAFDNSLLNEIDNTTVYRTFYDPFKTKKNQDNRTIKFPSKIKQKIGRFILQSIFIPDSRRNWKQYAVQLGDKIIAEHPDIKLIYATAPPFTDFLVANELSQKYNIPFVIDYRDLWVDNPQCFFSTPFHKRKHISLEQNVLIKTNKIFVITRQMKEKILSRYRFVKHQDISIISHGFDKEDFENVAPKEKTNKLIFTHSGIFPDDRTPKYFLKAISKFLNINSGAKDKIELRFVGLVTKQHIKLIYKYQLESISVITGYLPHKEAVQQIMSSDVLWLMMTNNIETPGKFFEYIGSKKPLLFMGPDGALKQIAEEYKASFITAPKNINSIVEKINTIYSLWENNNLPVPTNKFVNQYDREHLTSLLAKEMSFAVF